MTKQDNAIMIRDYKLLTHVSMTDEHLSKYTGIFECEGHPLHDKRFYQEVAVEVSGFYEWGKTKHKFYLAQKGSKSFRTIHKLIKFYENEAIHAPKDT